MHNKNLSQAKENKKDEFYTQFADIQSEMNAYLEYNPDVFRGKTVLLPCDDPEWSNFTKFFAQNFENFGLKKLISTSYAIESKNIEQDWQPTLFETENPYFDIDKTKTRGKIFTLDHDTNANGKIDIEDLDTCGGNVKRQEYLECALDWVSRGKIGEYMSLHRYDNDIKELQTYFNSVIDWTDSVFPSVKKEMCGQEWGRLYETYHGTPYNQQQVGEEVERLYADEYVTGKKGIFEYVLGGCRESRLLEVRVFDNTTKNAVYQRQTAEAQEKGVSNCPLCALGANANRTRIWKLGEMDADHVAAWSKGGGTTIENCEMLCQTHNRAKGNK